MTSFNCGRVAQSVEHLTAWQDVMGSIPMPHQYSGLRVLPVAPANVDHDAAYDDNGNRIISVGKALDCRAEGHRFYSHSEPILRVESTACCPANVYHDAAYDDDGLLPNVSTTVG